MREGRAVRIYVRCEGRVVVLWGALVKDDNVRRMEMARRSEPISVGCRKPLMGGGALVIIMSARGV